MESDDTTAKLHELDLVYNKIDKLYYGFARSCGLSSCAYWMLYEVAAEGSVALVELTEAWAYSKQTINSALKALQDKGLIELSFAEGSRKNKVAALTEAGRKFARKNLEPAMEAEHRAFEMLSAEEREQLACLMGRYAACLDNELSKLAL